LLYANNKMNFSFDIKTSADLFVAFNDSVVECQSDLTSTSKAVFAAMLGWSLCDWVYNEFPVVSSKHPKKKDFQAFVKSQCAAMGYLQDIANGTKHRSITMYTPIVVSADKHGGAFSSDFSREFDVSRLKMTLVDGTTIFFDNEASIARDYWRQYFSTNLGISV